MQPVADLYGVVGAVDVGHNQVIQADQSIERRADLVAHIGEEFALCTGAFNGLHGLAVVGNERQQHQCGCEQHHDQQECTQQDDFAALLGECLIFDGEHKIPVDIFVKGGQIHQPAHAGGVGIVEAEGFRACHTLGNFALCKFCARIPLKGIINVFLFVKV